MDAPWITPDFLRSSSRRLAASLTIAAVLSLTVMAGVSSAASLQVGKNNKSKGQTALASSSKKKAALAISNTGGAAAASFSVKKNKPPFTVSSTAKVKNLNADLLDGLDSSQLQLRISGACGPGSAVSAVGGNGSVSCSAFPAPTALPSNLQTRVGGTCAPASAIRIVNSDGTVVCQPVLVSVPPAWGLTGNAGTNPSSDFIGTTDNQPLVIRTNNTEAMRVTAGGQVGIGTTTPAAQLQAVSDTENAIEGTANTSIGVWGNSNDRGVVGTLGGTSCAGTYAVGGCGSTVGDGVEGSSTNGNGVDAGSTNDNGVEADSTNDNGVRANGGNDGVLASGGITGVLSISTSGVGVLGDSGAAQGVVGILGGIACPGTYGVGGCGGDNDGVLGSSSDNGVDAISSHPSGGNTAAAVLANNTGGGDIFIGEANGTHEARIDSSGKGFFDGGTQTGGADYAESIHAVDRAQLHPGDVLSIAPSHGYSVSKSTRPYSQLVVGVYSTKPAVLAVGSQGVNASLTGQVPVAMMGVVPTKVTATAGAIHPGDLLTTSRVPGYAMKAKATIIHGIAIYPQGTIVGKALQPLTRGQGVIEVMLMSR